MENTLLSTKSSKLSQVFHSRKMAINPKDVVESDGQINFAAFWQALWLTRENDEIRKELSDLSMSKILSESSLHRIEFFLPQLLTLMISEEASESKIMAARNLLTFACLHSIQTAVLAHLLLQSLLRKMCQEINSQGKKKKTIRQSLDDSFAVATQCLRSVERTLLFSTDEPSLSFEKRQQMFVEKVKEINEYVEHSLVKTSVSFRKVKQSTRDTPVSRLSASSKFQPKFLKIKNGFVYVHNDESHLLDYACPLADYLREKPVKISKLFDEEGKPPLGPQGTKHFFEVYIDQNTILQFEGTNETARKRFVKRLILEKDDATNVGNLVLSFAENDARRAKVNDIKLSVLRRQSSFLNKLEPIEDSKLHSVMSLSKWSASILNLESLIKNVLQDGSGSIMTFDCERLGQRLVDFLYDQTQVTTTGSFFTRFKGKRPDLVVGNEAELTKGKNVEEKQAPPEQSKMIWFARNSIVPGDLQKEMIARQWAYLIKDALKKSKIDKDLNNGTNLKDFTALIIEQNPFLPVSKNSFVEEIVIGAVSLEGVRKQYLREEDEEVTLLEHFQRTHEGVKLPIAQMQFTRGLAGCTLLAFVLDSAGAHDQRHILMLAEGSIMFSELSDCFSGEKTSFKLTDEMEELLSFTAPAADAPIDAIATFVNCCVKGFLTLRSRPLVELLLDSVKVVSSSTGAGFFDVKECAKLDKSFRSKLNLQANDEVAAKKFMTFLEKMCASYGMAKKLKQHFASQMVWL